MAATYKQRVQRLLKLWQKRLELTEWKIELKLLPEAADDCWGQIEWFADSREATMQITRDLGPWQLETTVVHELLHILLQGHRDYEGYDVNDERAINTLAARLVYDRGTRKSATLKG